MTSIGTSTNGGRVELASDIVDTAKPGLFTRIADSGIPLPLLRHNGRPDLVASIVVLLAAVLCVSLLLGGSTYTGHGLALRIPALADLSAALPAVGAWAAGLVAYVAKRGQDL